MMTRREPRLRQNPKSFALQKYQSLYCSGRGGVRKKHIKCKNGIAPRTDDSHATPVEKIFSKI